MVQINETPKNQFNPSKETPTQTLDVKSALTTPATVAPTMPTVLVNFDSMPDSAYIRLPIVKALYGISSATVWRNVKKRTIPAPIKISERCAAWSVSAIRLDLLAKAGG